MNLRVTNVAELTLENLQQQIIQLKRMIEEIPAGTGKRFTDSTVSPNFSSGNSGWRIGENGDVEFNSGLFRGTLSASNIIGSTISASTMQSTNITGGTIIGSTIKTGTSGQRVEITQATNSMRFYASNNELVMDLTGVTDYSSSQIELAGGIQGSAGASSDGSGYNAGWKLWAGGFGPTGITTFLEARNMETASIAGAISINTSGICTISGPSGSNVELDGNSGNIQVTNTVGCDKVDANEYFVGGTPGANFSGTPTTITVWNGIVTDIF